jgi:hypothetical protein
MHTTTEMRPTVCGGSWRSWRQRTLAAIRLSPDLLEAAFDHACVFRIRDAGGWFQAARETRVNRLMRATAKINKAHEREQSCASKAAKDVVADVHGWKFYGLADTTTCAQSHGVRATGSGDRATCSLLRLSTREHYDA